MVNPQAWLNEKLSPEQLRRIEMAERDYAVALGRVPFTVQGFVIHPPLAWPGRNR